MDDGSVDLSHLSVEIGLNGADVDLGCVGLYSHLGNGKEVGIGEELFLEVLMASEGLMQDLVGLVEDVVVEVAEVLEDELVACCFGV